MLRGFRLLDQRLFPQSGDGAGLWSVTDIRFGHKQDWPLEVRLERGGDECLITFENVASFRAQDESEILGYWSTREAEAVPVGTIYAIVESPYRDEFRDSVASSTAPLTHYLIAGYDLCVEVLAGQPPMVSTLPRGSSVHAP